MLRVLVFSDHAVLRAGLRAAIEAEPDLCVIADTDRVADARFFVERHLPQVVVVDAELKSRPALDVVRDIVAGNEPLRVVMLGLSADEEALIAALTAGASGYLTKDISPPALIQALRGIGQGQAAISRTLMMSVIDALRDFAGTTATAPEDPRLTKLTPREREVLELISDGVSNRQIAQRLVLSQHTVKNHVKAILAKLEVRSRTAAAAIRRPAGRPARAASEARLRIAPVALAPSLARRAG